MDNKNDLKVIQLKKQIEDKRKLMGDEIRFNPKTTCILEFDGIKYNLNVLNKNQLMLLGVKLNLFNEMSVKMRLDDELIIDGYNLSTWIGDIFSKLGTIKYKEEMKKLKLMESKLDTLLSEDKKIELEIDEIASMI